MLVPWHIRKVPLPAQVGSPSPPFKAHVPTTIPLLRDPVVVGVPLEVPVKLPVSVRVLPVGVREVTVKLKVPVTWLAAPVIKVALPVSVEPFTPLAKHFPALMKLKPVISIGPELVTENAVTKSIRLA